MTAYLFTEQNNNRLKIKMLMILYKIVGLSITFRPNVNKKHMPAERNATSDRSKEAHFQTGSRFAFKVNLLICNFKILNNSNYFCFTLPKPKTENVWLGETTIDFHTCAKPKLKASTLHRKRWKTCTSRVHLSPSVSWTDIVWRWNNFGRHLIWI